MRQSKKHQYYDDSYKGGKYLEHRHKRKSHLEVLKSIKPYPKHIKDK